ncbi:hypothetical protein IKG20_00380 [Candidatus Saccharibacteria bacterium]|nr:hypothetical protein [Candidatus Saccharibacteria bacterium]
MDNKDISKIPVSELTAENIDSLKGSAPEEAKKQVERDSKRASKANKASSRLPLVIAGILLLIGIGVALYFIFRQSPSNSSPEQSAEEAGDAEVVWEPEAGSENPSDDYIKHHQEIIDNPESTSEEKLDSKLSIANQHSTLGSFDKAQSILDSIDRTALSHTQTFNLYSAYAYLYECKGDTALQQEYLDLGRAELEKFWEDGEDTSTESGE